MRLKKILFPIDFSDRCASVASNVRDMAGSFGAELTLLHVVSPPVFPEIAYPGRLYMDLRKELLEASTGEMSRFAGSHFPSVALDPVVKEGDPARIIADYAHEHKFDLIMMPAHGYGPIRRFLIGSVTAKILHDARCPIWTSAHIEPTPRQSSGEYRNILCAVDCDSAAVRAIRWAGWLAGHYHAALKLVHVMPGIDETSGNPGEAELRERLFRRAGAEFEVLMDNAGFQSPLLLRGGNIPDRLAETAREQRADLMVTGRGHARLPLGRLGTHSLAIVRESPCPVLGV